MMLFLHLFNGQIMEFYPEMAELPYQPLFYIGSQPLEYIITRFCRPVPFFFILSGYGISCLHEKGSLTIKNQLKRLLKIFISYWLTLLIFVSLGHWLGYKNYPGSTMELIANISSYSNSYNLSMWFLFPYTLICLSSILIIKPIKSESSYILALIVTGLIYGATGFIIMHYIDIITYESLIGHLLQYLQYIFPFTCGIVMHKSHLLQHSTFNVLNDRRVTFFLLITVIILKSFLNSQALDTVYALFFIVLFLRLNIGQHISKCLYFLGKYSMVMWMTHMYLSHYFFTNFFYSFRYAPFIFTILVACSFGISVFITNLSIKIYTLWES